EKCIGVVGRPIVEMMLVERSKIVGIRPVKLITEPYIPFSDPLDKGGKIELSILQLTQNAILESAGIVADDPPVSGIGEGIVTRTDDSVTVKIPKADVAGILPDNGMKGWYT